MNTLIDIQDEVYVTVALSVNTPCNLLLSLLAIVVDPYERALQVVPLTKNNLSAVCRPGYGCWSARLFWRWIYKLQLLTVTPRVYPVLMLYHLYLATGNVIHIPRAYRTVMFYHLYLATGNAGADPVFSGIMFLPKFPIKARLHQGSVSTLGQCYEYTRDTALIENNGITPKWVATLFLSDFIVFNESSITSAVTALILMLCVNGP